MKAIKVLSFYDGMAGGYEALLRAGIPIETYSAAEIDPWAIKVAMYNHPDIKNIWDVCDVDPMDHIDTNIMFGGSPCQGFSIAGKKTGLTTNRGHLVDSLEFYNQLKKDGYDYDKSSSKYFNTSCLIWEQIRVYRGIKDHNPNLKFFFENVVSKKWAKFISKELGCEPIRINSSVVSAQNRDRYYWTDIEYTPIPVSVIPLNDVIFDAFAGAGTRGVKQKDWVYSKDNPFKHLAHATVRTDGLANCLTASGGRICRKYLPNSINVNEFHKLYSKAKTKEQKKKVTDKYFKDISITQAEQLQTVTPGYTNVPGVSEAQRFKMLGNGWTIDVITHFFRCYKKEVESKTETHKWVIV